MNSKQKGSRGERALRDVWKAHGYEDAHRSQQYSGKGESSADIEGIDPRLHIECKTGYSFKQIYNFMEQAKRDAKEGQTPICNIKMDRMPWLWVCYLDDGIEMWKNQAEMIPIIPMEIMVVRCKDCRWWNEDVYPRAFPEKKTCMCECPNIYGFNHFGRFTQEDEFCSRGERR